VSDPGGTALAFGVILAGLPAYWIWGRLGGKGGRNGGAYTAFSAASPGRKS
jgi:hypothetical protein